MQESEARRAQIVKRLKSLDMSTKRELEDIITLTSLICKSPIVLITLLDDQKQYIHFQTGLDVEETPLEDAFCRFTILQDEVLEVKDSLLDGRFVNNPLVTGFPNIRFYAGSPLQTQSGQNIGSLCVIDQKPNVLTEEQKQVLKILAHQVSTILEFELSLKMLREETGKVQESEIKLKSIFQSSPTAHIFVNKEMIVLAFNRSAADFVTLLNDKAMKEGQPITSFISENAIEFITHNISLALAGERVYLERKAEYERSKPVWWAMEFNPVKNHHGEIIGVSIDSTDVTERVNSKEEILQQNNALRKIAQIQSHEIRRPVANIIGLLGLLEDSNSDDFVQNYQFMKEEVASLDKKIHDIVRLTETLDF